MARHTPEENAKRLAKIDADLALARRERSIAAKERALDYLEQSNARARWLEVKTRALEILSDTPERKAARESTARAKETIARVNRLQRGWRLEAETRRFIAGEIARQQRERWKR